MSYQKCPKCNGLGSTGIGFPVGERCNVCNGTCIISEQTGKPPEVKLEYSNSTELSGIRMASLLHSNPDKFILDNIKGIL